MNDAASPLYLARVRCASTPRAGAAEDRVVLAARARHCGPESADDFALPGAAAKRAVRDSGGGGADGSLFRRDLLGVNTAWTQLPPHGRMDHTDGFEPRFTRRERRALHRLYEYQC